MFFLSPNIPQITFSVTVLDRLFAMDAPLGIIALRTPLNTQVKCVPLDTTAPVAPRVRTSSPVPRVATILSMEVMHGTTASRVLRASTVNVST
jgi:hypothetical protein